MAERVANYNCVVILHMNTVVVSCVGIDETYIVSLIQIRKGIWMEQSNVYNNECLKKIFFYWFMKAQEGQEF